MGVGVVVNVCEGLYLVWTDLSVLDESCLWNQALLLTSEFFILLMMCSVFCGEKDVMVWFIR